MAISNRMIPQCMNRPKLSIQISITDFKDFYWLKEELVLFCRENGINTSGGKLELTDKISQFLISGNIIPPKTPKKTAQTSTFDWNTERLSLASIITDNYRNTENVRSFFKQTIGEKFRFNVAFMDWMKANNGRTLGDAMDAWTEIAESKKDTKYKSYIAPQFEYNTYMRDFLADNTHLTAKHAMESWKIKRDKRGSRKYCKDDLQYLME